MTQQDIMMAGLRNFAEHGYEGASMAMIADAVGIKKQSIYTHFKNKDALFLAVCEECITQEMDFIQMVIESQQNYKELFERYIARYQHNAATKFWLRMMFFPPQHLYDEVMDGVYRYLEAVEELATDMFAMAETVTRDVPPTILAQSYLALLDSIFVELLYGDSERAHRRLEAAYTVFARGI